MVPTNLLQPLSIAADREVSWSLRRGAAAFGQKPPNSEVGFVAAFVLAGVPAIAKAWRPILRTAGLSVQMAGVFIHQTPQVKFTDSRGIPRKCELADLLIVVDHLTSRGMGRRVAALVQAKMASPSGVTTLRSPGDMVQLELLSTWPPFTMPRRFAPGPRDFSNCTHSGSLQDCGRYGLISPQSSPDWRQSAPSQTISSGGMQLGTFAARMLGTGQTGFGREATGLADDWSRTVDELLTISGGTAFRHAASLGGRRPLRGSVVTAFVIDRDYFVLGRPLRRLPPFDTVPEDVEQNDSEGISFVHISISGD